MKILKFHEKHSLRLPRTPQHNTKGKYKENHIYLKENHV